MKFYPINLNVKNKKCLVFGGGKVATRKIHNLIKCGATVMVVSPKITASLVRKVTEKKIAYIEQVYKKDMLDNSVFLVFAATSDLSVNQKIATEASRKNILVNVCDSAALSDFILPAFLRRKGMTISVSSDGHSPKQSKQLKNYLKEILP